MSLSKSSTSDIVKKYGSNDKDTGSTAVQIALLSKRIEDLQKHFKDHKKDNHSRTGLLQIVSDRKKLLSYLKKKRPFLLRKDNKRFKTKRLKMKNYIKKEIPMGSKTLVLETGKIARQATASVVASMGGTVVMCAVVTKQSAEEGISFH